MISYKTYKLINESFGGPMALGLAPVRSIGVAGSKLSEMGLRPDEMDDLDHEEPDGDEGLEDMGPEVDVDDMGDMEGNEMGMDDEMGDEMGAEDAPFPPDELEDMHSLAGLGGDDDLDGLEDGDGDMDDMEDEMEDEDDMDDDGVEPFRFPMESKKYMCPETSDDEEHQKEDDKKKYMKKNMSSCGTKKMMKKKGYDEAKASFWDDFLRNAAGNHKFAEDAVIPPSNPNTGLGDAAGATPGDVGSAPQQRLGIGSGNGRVETDFFGYQAIQ